MRRRCIQKILAVGGIGWALVMAAGCSSSSCKERSASTAWRDAIPSEPNSNLVMSPPQLAAMDGGPWDWEYARNDDLMGVYDTDPVASFELVQVRQWELLRTINGTPNEFSTTFTQTLKRGVAR